MIYAALAALVMYAFDLDLCFIVSALGSAAFGLVALIEWGAARGREPSETRAPPEPVELGLPLRRFRQDGDELFGTTFRCGTHVVTLVVPQESAAHARAGEELVRSSKQLETAFEAFIAREVTKFAAVQSVTDELRSLHPSMIVLDGKDPAVADVYLMPGDYYSCTLRGNEFAELAPTPTVE
jgi:hypothetical protein